MLDQKFSDRDRLIVAAGQKVKEREYWTAALAGELNRTIFPADHENSGKDAAVPDREVFSFSHELTAALDKLSSGTLQTLLVILTAGLTALMHRYTGNTDLILGTPILKQSAQKEGDLINKVLALRNRVQTDPPMTFKELLVNAGKTMVEAMAHQAYPLEILVEELGFPAFSLADDFALFDIAVVLENIQDKSYMAHLPVSIRFSFNKEGDRLKGEVEYRSNRYQKDTIRRLIDHYLNLMGSAVKDVERTVAELELLTSEEKHRVLDLFNDNAREFQGEMTLHHWFQHQVEKTPGNIALVENTYGGESREITYMELNRKANRFARMLRDKGVGRGTVVALLLEPSLEMVTGLLGIVKAGAAYLPIDRDYPQKRVTTILQENKVKYLVTRRGLVSDIPYTTLMGLKSSGVKPLQTAPRPPIPDFDSLPLPDRTLVNYSEYHKYIGEAMAHHTVSIQSTRGCPYNCLYCHKVWPKKHIVRSSGNIFQELKRCYDAGVKRFTFIDDIFNLNRENSMKLLEDVVKHGMDIQIFYPNGLRGDILTPDFIDLLVQAGTVNLHLALETASPRLQKLLKKNLNLAKFEENLDYIIKKHPGVVLGMESMIGFPTETEEEAMMTLNFLKSKKWVHLPNLHVLKIFPNTEMHRLAVENGVSDEAIERSSALAYHELPETLPFPKSFVVQFQQSFLNEYFLLKERLLKVLPAQMKIFTEHEIVSKYDSYLPMAINSFSDLLDLAGIAPGEFENREFLADEMVAAPRFCENMRELMPVEPVVEITGKPMKVLLMDLSQFFTSDQEHILHHMIDEPLGLMYLLTYIRHRFPGRIDGKIAKSKIDFDSYDQLKALIDEYQPDLIGLRTLTYFKEFFHQAVAKIREWGVTVPIITGGPYATSDHTLVLQDKNIDLVVMGEGEYTFGELIEAMLANEYRLPPEEELKQIQGITFIPEAEKAKLSENRRELCYVDEWDEILPAYKGENLDVDSQPDDLLYLISTSGSTGKPKSVMLEHRNLANLMHFQFNETILDFSGSVMQFASIGFDVSAQEIFSTLLSGGRIQLIDRDIKSDVMRLLELIEETGTSVFIMPPAFLKYIFSDPDYVKRFPDCVRHIISSGDRLVLTEPLRKFASEKGIYIHNQYGPSETHVVTSITLEPSNDLPGLPVIGYPVSNTRIYILDRYQNPLPPGVPGELCVAGANVGRGYYKNPESTAKKFLEIRGERVYRTGDLAKWRSNGTIEFIGRLDHQVKVRGYRIELGEIESHLRTIGGIDEVVVVNRKDENGDTYLCAYYVSGAEVDVTELRETLGSTVPDFMLPSYFIRLERMPLNANGKIDRKRLPEPEAVAAAGYCEPRDQLEKALVEIWSDILAIDASGIGIDANFFQMGGHSLKATILISRIHKTFNVKITLAEMFEAPTVRGLSEYIRERMTEQFSGVRPVEEKEYYPLSPVQERLFIFQQMKLDNTSLNLPHVVVIEGKLDRDRVQRTFDGLIGRHESMRSSFGLLGDETYQKIHPPEEVNFKVRYGVINEGEPVESRMRDFVIPFDLSQVPLLRVQILTILSENGKEPGSHYMMFDMHHIISDGISMGLFLQEFMDIYADRVLPELPLQYRDFAVWQRQYIKSESYRRCEDYWLSRFNDPPAPLRLPTDHPRHEARRFEGRRYFAEIEPGLSAKMNRLASETGSTLFMVMMAAYSLLLSKYTGHEDIVVGSGVAGRPHADLEKIMGFFINMLAMRNKPNGDKTFLDFLAEVRTNTLDALANQDYQYEELVAKLGLQGDAGGNPLFETILQFQNFYIPEIDIPGIELKHHPYESGTSRFDLVIYTWEEGSKIQLMVLYSSSLFELSSMEKLVKRFIEVLTQAMETPGILLKDIIVSQELESVKTGVLEAEKGDFDF